MKQQRQYKKSIVEDKNKQKKIKEKIRIAKER